MTATATLIVVGVVLFVKNKIQKHRRGYYRWWFTCIGEFFSLLYTY
jgi:hypothetical protein